MHKKLRHRLASAAVVAAVLAIPAVGLAAGALRAQFDDDVIGSAAAFQTYVRQASQLRGDFTDGKSVAEALVIGSAYESNQLLEGEIAYGAMIALQDPAFVRGVREAADSERGAERLVDDLIADPRGVLRIDGAPAAAAMVEAALRAQGDEVLRAGRSVKQAAYDLQRQPWSKETVPNATGRLARVKAVSAARFNGGPADAERLLSAAAEMRGTVPGRSYAPSTAVQRSLVLAAAAVSGEAFGGDALRLKPLLTDQRAGTCLRMAKLNLYQCLAVSGPHYEDMFCLGQHALIDTGKCVSDAASSPASATRDYADLPRNPAPRTTGH